MNVYLFVDVAFSAGYMIFSHNIIVMRWLAIPYSLSLRVFLLMSYQMIVRKKSFKQDFYRVEQFVLSNFIDVNRSKLACPIRPRNFE